MILSIIVLIIGFSGLLFSADKFTDSSAKIANLFHIPPLIIGVAILGFGTSAPEIFVSSLAAFNNNSTLGVGNAIGSNITNIALILGITALIKPITIADNILKKEWIILAFSTIFAWLLLLDNFLSRIDGIILFISLILFLFFIIKQAKNNKKITYELEKDVIIEVPNKEKFKVWVYLFLSLLLLLVSAQMSVFGAVSIAKLLGISELVVGLTIVALGTSLPELAVSILAVLKKQDDLIVGNIIGSNLFNTLAVLAMPGIINPTKISSLVIDRDFPILFILTFLLFLLSYSFTKRHSINRVAGFVFLAVFVYYMSILF